MNYLHTLLLLAICCSFVTAQDSKLTQEQIDKATEEGLKSLQGLWAFQKGEHNGSGNWTLPEECLYIQRQIMHHTRKNGEFIFNGARMEITIDPTTKPATIDMVRQIGRPGQKILGIYKIEGDLLILATNTTNSEKRPSKFNAKLTAGQGRATDLQIYRRVMAEAAEKPPVKKFTPEELDAANAAILDQLQGLWMFEKSERSGSWYWVLPEEAIYIEKNVLQHVKKNGELIFNGSRLEISVDASNPWTAMDMVRKNGAPGVKVMCIIKIVGDRLIIASNTSEDLIDLRPAQFTAKLTAGLERASVVQTFKRVKAEAVEKPPVKKLTPEQLDAANAAALKELQGQWIFEKAEQNGFSYWVLPQESIYIEKNLLREVKKNGDLIFNGAALDIKVDASQPWTAIDLVRKNGSPGAKIHGIYKIVGNRLIIATNTSEDLKDLRPAQFSVRLTAGLERASIVQTYKRAKE